MGIIKTGLFVDGVEITSEHIGKKLEVLKSNSDRWLPVGFVAVIVGVDDNVISLQDRGGASSFYEVGLGDADDWKFKWVTHPKPKKSSKEQRQKLAKAIREAKTVLDTAIKEAEEVGMVVDIFEDCVKITFNPPVEEH